MSRSPTTSTPGRAALLGFSAALLLILVLPFAAGQLAAETKAEDVFKELKVNDAGRGTAVFTLDTKSTDILSKDALTFTFNEVCGKVKSYQVYITEPCYQQRPVYKYTEVCEDTENKTKACSTRQDLTGYEDYLTTCDTPVASLPAGTKDYKLTADITPAYCGADWGWGYKVDWIPHLQVSDKTLSMDAWAWWNLSLNTDLISFYSFEEGGGTKVYDLYGNINLTLNGHTAFTTGKIEDGVYMDGNGDYLVPTSKWVSMNKDVGVFAWVNLTRITDASVICVRPSGQAAYDWLYFIDGSIQQLWIWKTASSNNIHIYKSKSQTTPSEKTWTFIGFNYDYSEDDVTFYMNNISYTNTTPTTSSANYQVLAIGSNSYSTEYFYGVLDEIGIWGRNLNAGEISILYNNGTGIYFNSSDPSNINYSVDYDASAEEWHNSSYLLYVKKDEWVYDTLQPRFLSGGTYYLPTANATNATHHIYNYTRLVPNGTGAYQFKWVINHSLAAANNQTSTSLYTQNITAYNHSYAQGIAPLVTEWDTVTYDLSIQRAHTTANITAGLYWNGTVYAPTRNSSNATAFYFEYDKIIPIGTPTLGIYWAVNHTYLGTIRFNTTLENQSYLNFSVTPNLIYNATLYETDPNNLTIALPKHDTANISALSLTWGGVDQGSPDLNATNATHFKYTYTIPMPLYLSGVKNFTFNYTYSYIGQTWTNTTSASQNITEWGLFYCTGAYNTTCLQFTTLDENTLDALSMPIYGHIAYYRLVPTLNKYFYFSFNETAFTYLDLNASVTDTANLAQTGTATSVSMNFMVKMQSIISSVGVYVSAHGGVIGQILEGSCSGAVLATASNHRSSPGVITLAYDVPSYLNVLQPGTTYCLKLTRDYGSFQMSYNGLVTYDGTIGSVYAQNIPSGAGAGGVTWTKVDSVTVAAGLNNTRICIAPVDLELYADGEIITEKAITRRHYLLNASLSAASTDLQLFNMEDDSNTSVVKLILVNDAYSVLASRYIKMLRYYPGTNDWKLIGMGKTDQFGRTYQALRTLDTKYKFIFQNYTTVLDTTQELTFYCPTFGECTVTFIVDTSETSGGWFDGFSYGYDSTTKIFTLTWNDATGLTDNITLLAYTETTDGRRVWCDTTTAAASGSIECNLTSAVGTVVVVGYRQASPVKTLFTYIIDEISKSLTEMFETYGYANEGMFMAALTGGIILTLGAFSAVTMVITVPLAFLVFWILGLANFINMTFLILASIAAIILTALVGRRTE